MMFGEVLGWIERGTLVRLCVESDRGGEYVIVVEAVEGARLAIGALIEWGSSQAKLGPKRCPRVSQKDWESIAH